ncbi:hypothetical protein FPSE_00333 [Fusarium pseudograminearum CS3096]|uniref:Uncharacterized protein n=1 Tax=Fusarium pseudograminearum (strain CS3096) TaxID=1028729 RepID=K3VV16_FUSPC|nr:hypothetical protein FPSE_00333 [Fusarium pseudograminearum CS3096]EKJ79514.1 hypothetical protein FPSE_00333 [Fusarium pseudograminearum CS3096]
MGCYHVRRKSLLIPKKDGKSMLVAGVLKAEVWSPCDRLGSRRRGCPMPHEIGSGKAKGSLNDDRPIDDEINRQETQK